MPYDNICHILRNKTTNKHTFCDDKIRKTSHDDACGMIKAKRLTRRNFKDFCVWILKNEDRNNHKDNDDEWLK